MSGLALPEGPDSAMKIGPKRWLQHRPALTTTQGFCDMAAKQLPTQAELRKLLDYDPESGVLTWLPRPIFDGCCVRAVKMWNKAHAGKEAFTETTRAGYKRGSIHNRQHKAHRVIWKWVHGFDPEEIDHINGDRSDNRIVNLRSVSRIENNRNRAKSNANKSGVVGVHFCNRDKAWIAQIKVGGRNKILGYSKDFAEAVAARKEGEKLYGFHENHGR